LPSKKNTNQKRKKLRGEIQSTLIAMGVEHWKHFSPVILSNWQIVVETLIPQYCKEKVLDTGCGDAPYFEVLQKYCSNQFMLDHTYNTDSDINIVGDLLHLPFIENSFETCISLQVLEHVKNPFQAIDEIARVLKVGGHLILSVPHLSRLHEIPHDYFRYTEYGLKELMKNAGLEIVFLESTGGLFLFLGHQLSLYFMTSLWSVKFVRKPVFWINKNLITKLSIQVDKWIGHRKLFPQGYVLVAKK